MHREWPLEESLSEAAVFDNYDTSDVEPIWLQGRPSEGDSRGFASSPCERSLGIGSQLPSVTDNSSRLMEDRLN